MDHAFLVRVLDGVADLGEQFQALAHGEPQELARTVLDLVRQRLEEDCRRSELNRQWTAYEARVLRPLLYGCQPATVESLAPMLGATGPEVSHMIETVRRKSVKVLREVVADTLENPEDLDDEIDALWRYLAE